MFDRAPADLWQLWEKHLASYREYPPLQVPETYNLSGILDQMKKASHSSD